MMKYGFLSEKGEKNGSRKMPEMSIQD
jgi:hypothetical protein